jgi:thiamine-monophosphate kinase
LNDAKNRPSEFDLIEKLFVPLAESHAGAAELKDDCATLSVSRGYEALYSMDTLVEGVHFFKGDPANLIAKKLLRVSLSDLASSGGTPRGYLLALSLPPDISYEWLQSFAAGLSDDQIAYRITLLGGDTTSTAGPLTLSLTAVGEVPTGRAIRRSGAVVGDDIFVTGTIGDAAIALRLFQEIGRVASCNKYPALYDRYFLPQPRTALGPLMVGTASACVDISDGLLADLGHICDASGVGATVFQADIPLSSGASLVLEQQQEYWEFVFGGGDDYELLFSAASEKKEIVQRLGKQAGLSVTRIGSFVSDERISVLDSEGKQLTIENTGWKHF